MSPPNENSAGGNSLAPQLNDWLEEWVSADKEPVFLSNEPREWLFIAAAWQREPVTFRYWGGSAPGTVRTIIPRKVFRVPGYEPLYFSGWCELRQEERTFRVDRAVPQVGRG